MITPTQLFLTCARRICAVLAIWALAAAYGGDGRPGESDVSPSHGSFAGAELAITI